MAPSTDDTVLKLEKFLCMKGGNGAASYASNSEAQARHARSVLHLLEETLDMVHLDSPDLPFHVIDLGCSSGINTVSTMDIIVGRIASRYASAGLSPPEFSAFFSDLPSNDFNNLFKLLNENNQTHRSYFANGVPGTFYRRLFPKRSVNVFHSAFCLHWLSQVPESVCDEGSPAYNKGHVYIDGASEESANAYKNQFQSDLAGFLKERSIEMKRGGAMFLVCLGRTSPNPADQGGPGLLFCTHYQQAWDDLVNEGLLKSEKRDSFNIPVYAPSLHEFKEVVEADGSFVINKLDVFKGGSPLVVKEPGGDVEVGRAFVNTCRSITEVLVDAHIGDELSEELFRRVEIRATRNAKELLENLQFYHIVASLSLR